VADPFFDTNILIDWLRDNPKAISELSRYKKHRISRVVWTEILAGEPLERRDTIQQIIINEAANGANVLWIKSMNITNYLPRKSIFSRNFRRSFDF
jgi:predicted nucleic acid-binding protein